MRVCNKSSRMYQHGEYNLPAGANIEVPEDIAKLWIETGDIIEFVKPEEAKAKEAELQAENAKLKAEIEKLKADAEKKPEEAKDEVKTLEELKKEADDLGIEYGKTISAKTLQERIEAKKAEKE